MTRALRQLDGIRAVQASSATQQVIVDFDPSWRPVQSIQEALERMGFQVEVAEDGHVVSERSRGQEAMPDRSGQAASAGVAGADAVVREEGRAEQRLRLSGGAAGPGEHGNRAAASRPGDRLEKLQIKIGGIECSSAWARSRRPSSAWTE